ncbi:MAG: cytochrome c [Arenimonas sp.]|nr:cytochrome c [Arenimonas sp.]MBP7917474.1 cytochrome c [Arenimonas sp.]
MSNKILLVCVLGVFAGQTSAMGVSGNAAAGKQKAVTVCAACHGADGNKTLDDSYPKLAGQYPDYMLKALKEYKSGKRSNAIMAGQVQALSEADMANLVLYYASLKSQIGTLPK